jgi:precorrin-6x reductase
VSKFLIINRPPPHPTKRVEVAGCVRHFVQLAETGRARVFPIVGSKGYATFVDVSSHEELADIIADNPMRAIEEYRVIALRELRE